jgi:hypothetical protein
MGSLVYLLDTRVVPLCALFIRSYYLKKNVLIREAGFLMVSMQSSCHKINGSNNISHSPHKRGMCQPHIS